MKINKRKIKMSVFEKQKGDEYDFVLKNQILTCRVYHKNDLIDTISVTIEKFCDLDLANGNISDYDAWQLLKQHRLSAN